MPEHFEPEQTQRESELRWATHRDAHKVNQIEIDRRFFENAEATDKALKTARAALDAALADHQREHLVHEQAHGREHLATEQALAKAEASVEKRFTSVNEFREQLRDQAKGFASAERLDVLVGSFNERSSTTAKDTDRRFTELIQSYDRRHDALAQQVIDLQKHNIADEGKGRGQSMVIAAIVGSVGLAATVLGIIIVASNVLTGTP